MKYRGQDFRFRLYKVGSEFTVSYYEICYAIFSEVNAGILISYYLVYIFPLFILNVIIINKLTHY